MNQRDQIKKILAGLFAVLGLAIIAWVVMFIGVEKGLTEPKFPIVVYFHDVSGLSHGAPVRLSGVNIGVVKKIDFLPQEVYGRALKVDLDIFERYREFLYKGTRIIISTEGVLGEKFVEISVEPGDRALNFKEPILGLEPLGISDMAELLEDTAASFHGTTESVNSMMSELRYITYKARRLMNRIEEKVLEGNLFKVF